jgi:serine/threonine-protein kinase
VYTAGVLLFELLAGVAPFSGELPQLLRQHLADDLPPIASLRRGVKETTAFRSLLARATAKPPRERFADAGELGLALRNLPRPWLT